MIVRDKKPLLIISLRNFMDEKLRRDLADLINSNQGFATLVDEDEEIKGYIIYGKVNPDKISYHYFDPLIEREDASFLIFNVDGWVKIDTDNIKDIDLEKREVVYADSAR